MERQNDKNKDRDIILLINACAGETTAHCLPHIVRAKGTFRRSTWIIVTVGLISVWLFHSYSTIAKYLKFEVNIRTEVITARQLPNPAVTVCNKNAFNGLAVQRYIDNMAKQTRFALDNNLRNASLYGPEWFPSWLEAYEKAQSFAKTGSNDNLIQLFGELADTYGKTYGVTYRNFTIKYDRFVQRCYYEREPCYKSGVRHKLMYNWLYGDCFTFIIAKNATRTGPRSGLQLTLFIDQEKYSELTTNAGVQVLVHPPGQMPFPDEDGISIPPGQAAFVGVRMSRLKRLEGRYETCFNEVQQNATLDYFKQSKYVYSTSYSLRTCERSCFQQRLMNKCRCLDNRYPPYIVELNITNYNSCISDYLSTFNLSGGLPDNYGCRDKIEKKFNNFQLGCDAVCHVPCISTSYDTSVSYSVLGKNSQSYVLNTTKFESAVSYSRWPSDKAMNESLKTMPFEETHLMSDEEFRRNFLRVTVFFQNFNYELTTETLAVSISQMLSDLGGNLGLYIGASLVTFFEFTQLLFDALMFCCRCSRAAKARDVANGRVADNGQAGREFYQIRL